MVLTIVFIKETVNFEKIEHNDGRACSLLVLFLKMCLDVHCSRIYYGSTR